MNKMSNSVSSPVLTKRPCLTEDRMDSIAVLVKKVAELEAKLVAQEEKHKNDLRTIGKAFRTVIKDELDKEDGDFAERTQYYLETEYGVLGGYWSRFVSCIGDLDEDLYADMGEARDDANVAFAEDYKDKY